MPGLACLARICASQLVRRMQPCDSVLPILDGSGVTIGSHTVNHAFLPGVSAEETRLELAGSKKRLEDLLGHEVKLFSYPGGGVTPFLRR